MNGAPLGYQGGNLLMNEIFSESTSDYARLNDKLIGILDSNEKNSLSERKKTGVTSKKDRSSKKD